MRKWDDHCAVPVGMYQIAIAHRHAEDAHLGAECNGLGVRMRIRDVSREKLKPRRPLVEIANRAIGDQSQRAQADVNGRLDFAPKCAATRISAVKILDDDDRRFASSVDMAVI